MRITINREISHKFAELEPLARDLQQLVHDEVAALKARYVGKWVRVDGQKGWNKGIIWDVGAHGSLDVGPNLRPSQSGPCFYFSVGPDKHNSRTYRAPQITLLTDEEIQQDQRILALDKRINERGRLPASGSTTNPPSGPDN